jgi:hypothetical protein
MEIPNQYKEADKLLILGIKDNLVGLDIFIKEDYGKISDDEAKTTILEISSGLISQVASQVEKNEIHSAAPLINLCKFLVQEFPEIVLDDETYVLRRSLLRMEDSIKSNLNADEILDAFMEVEHGESRYQLRLEAMKDREQFISPEKIKVISYE